MDPILRCLRAATQLPQARHHKGSLGGCADDAGMVMPRLRGLVGVPRVFLDIERFAFLRLQGANCVVVPLWAKCTEVAQDRVRNELCRWIPQWTIFKIAGHAVYLGVEMGPAAALGMIWAAAAEKWWSRTIALPYSGAGLSVFFNSVQHHRSLDPLVPRPTVPHPCHDSQTRASGFAQATQAAAEQPHSC
eukprot:5569618-Pyramimonas_sp.AAC.1